MATKDQKGVDWREKPHVVKDNLIQKRLLGGLKKEKDNDTSLSGFFFVGRTACLNRSTRFNPSAMVKRLP